MNEDYLSLHGKKSQNLKLNIYPSVDFREVLKTLNSIRLPEYLHDREGIKYAVLELLNNSLRAHRNKNVKRPVITTFNISDYNLKISIKDFGGGFDPKVLPYNLEDHPEQIDHTGLLFQEYQQKHNFLRFGMGILIAKKTFSHFKITFFDHNENPTDWESGNIYGTLIKAVAGEAGHGN